MTRALGLGRVLLRGLGTLAVTLTALVFVTSHCPRSLRSTRRCSSSGITQAAPRMHRRAMSSGSTSHGLDSSHTT